MNSRRLLVLALAGLLMTVACSDDLIVDLPDDEKDGLAAYVEGGDSALGGDIIDFEPTPTQDYASLDHLAWDAITRRHVEPAGVDYSGFSSSADSVELLDAYLELLSTADPAALESDTERLAFWLNAYNALVFSSVASALEEDPAFRVDQEDFAFFKVKRHVVGGELYSLDQLEHGVVRGDRAHDSVAELTEAEWEVFAERHADIFGEGPTDPRIHVGLNCASRSCPALPAYAYRADDLHAQLDRQTADFVSDPNRGAGPEGISMLFTWFRPDFEATHDSPRGFIEAFRADVSEVDFDRSLTYDWSLNGD